jgi:hypothetical protein
MIKLVKNILNTFWANYESKAMQLYLPKENKNSFNNIVLWMIGFHISYTVVMWYIVASIGGRIQNWDVPLHVNSLINQIRPH